MRRRRANALSAEILLQARFRHRHQDAPMPKTNRSSVTGASRPAALQPDSTHHLLMVSARVLARFVSAARRRTKQALAQRATVFIKFR